MPILFRMIKSRNLHLLSGKEDNEMKNRTIYISFLLRVLQHTTFIERNLACESEQDRCVLICQHSREFMLLL